MKNPYPETPKTQKKKTTTEKGGHLPIILVDMERTWWNLICSRPKKNPRLFPATWVGSLPKSSPKNVSLVADLSFFSWDFAY